MLLEQFPGGHAHHAGVRAITLHLLVGCNAERDLAPTGQQQHIGSSTGIGEHVGALRRAGSRCVLRAIQRRQRLPRQDQQRRLMPQLHDDPPGFDDFVGICRSEHNEIGNRPERRELLNGLMGRAVFAQTDRIMGEDVDDRDLHERRQTDCRLGVIAEDQEAGSVRPYFGKRQSVKHGAHRMLTDAEVEVPAAVRSGCEIPRPVERDPRLGRWRQIRRTADQPRHMFRDGIQHLA